MHRHTVHQDLLVGLQKANTVKDVGLILAEIQKMFGFLWYYVLDTSRLAEKVPVSLLFPSNIGASFFRELEEYLTDYVSIFENATDMLYPSRCDVDDAVLKGKITKEAADVFSASRMLRGATFPALGISGVPRIIGFSGTRSHLEIEEIEELNVITSHVHTRLTAVGRNFAGSRQALSGLEQQVISLASDSENVETIATRMKLSSITISYLIESICQKMEVATIEHAVAVTMRRRMMR